MSAVREKIEKAAQDHWLEVKGDCAMLDFSHGAQAGYRLALEVLRESEDDAPFTRNQVADYLESLLEAP